MSQKFKNNANALVASTIAPGDLTFTVEASKSDSFPVADTGTDPVDTVGKDWFRAVLENSAGDIEVVHVRTRNLGSGVMSNVIRAQEGTIALAFAIGSVCELRFTAADIAKATGGSFETLTVTGAASIGGKITHNAIEGRITPVGGIIMWSGAIANIPSGWQLCDGTNGTPNLRDKFIVGAGTTYAVGAAGGSKDAVAVSHTHTASFAGSAMGAHGHSVSQTPHTHNTSGEFATYGAFPNVSGVLTQTGGTTPTSGANANVSVVAASAGTPAGAVTVDSGGISGTDKNLPPYYALAYIRCMEYV